MKIAVMTRLFTKRNMDVDAGHWDKGKRNYGFLNIYVDKDGSDSGTQISEAYKEKLK